VSSVELSEAQFDRLVSMIADNRVAMHTVKNELVAALEASEERIKKELQFLRSSMGAIEEDVGKMQVSLRKLLERQGEHGQALDGLTQLGKTNFDMNESILKEIHGDSGPVTLSHGETEESLGTGRS